MEYREWLKQLKPGDEVIIEDFNGEIEYKRINVEEITPSGSICVDGILYKSESGKSRIGQYRILNPNDEDIIKLLKERKEYNLICHVLNKISLVNEDELSYEQAIEICKIMGWRIESE